MRCLSTALASACLLAPALARAESSSSAYIVFEDLPQDFPVDYLDFALNVNEATDPCGPVNATINNQALPEVGAGTFTTRQEYTFDATWNFACVGAKEQAMSLSINSVSGVAIKDLEISVRFRQAVPVTISSIRGPASMALFGGGGDSNAGSEQQLSPDKLAAELDEIDTLRARAGEIHRIIRTHERLIAESYGWVRGDAHRGPQDCDSIGCFVTSLLDKARSLAALLFRDGHGHHHRHHRWRGPPRWWRHRHHHPGDGPGCGPGGNHTEPGRPPSRRPHFRHGPPRSEDPLPPHEPSHQYPERPAPSSDKTEGPISGHADWSWPSINHPLHGLRFGGHGLPEGGPPGSDSRQYDGRWLSLLTKFSLYSILLGVIIALMHQLCSPKQDEEKDENATTWWQRFQARRETRKRRRLAVKRALGRVAASLRRIASGTCGDADDEEKAAMAVETQQEQRQQQLGGGNPGDDNHDGGRDGDMDTTVDEEIAGLRVAADVVADIIAAQQNAARRQLQQQRQQHHTEMATAGPRTSSMADQGRQRPLSSTDVLTGYAGGRRSTDSGYSRYSEALPAYEATEASPSANTGIYTGGQEENVSPASSLVADGFMYTPGSSAYVPGSRSSSLPGLGSADALGDTKN